jgi:pimeloyl-ACP methyl ester carboxylesterase
VIPLKTLLLAAALLSGHWEGEAVKDGKTFRIHVDVSKRGDVLVATVDYVDYALYGVPFVATVDEKNAVRIERNPPGGPHSILEGTVKDGRLTGTFTGAGAKGAALTLRRTSRRARTLREVPVAWRNGDVALAGTLILPEGRGPFPAVAITHGGDPEHRGEAGYWSEGVLFARAGVAALVYDKRGVGESTGDWTTSSLEDFAGDALAGLAAIKRFKEIDPRRLGVSGHSQGGWIAPIAAVASPDVAFVVVTSPSGINAMDQSVFHTSNLLRQAGYSAEVVARAADLRNRMYQRARTGTVDDRFLADLERASREPWFETARLPWPWSETLAEGTRRLLLFEPVPTWERVRVPVLAIWGEADPNLPAKLSRDLIEAALERGGNANRSLTVIPGLNHNLAAARPPGVAWDFPRRPAQYEMAVRTWLQSRVVRSGTERGSAGGRWKAVSQ